MLGRQYFGHKIARVEVSQIGTQDSQVSKTHHHTLVINVTDKTGTVLRKPVLLLEELGIADVIIEMNILYLTN